jgi:hypothetical protein
VRWVQKVSNTGELAQQTSFLIRDAGQHADTSEELEGSISPERAQELVATGEWKYVDEIERR